MKKLLVVFLLLISFWLRLHELLQLPGFIDEGNHLRWASEVWQGRWVFPLSSGKPLLIYYLALFFPFPAALWLGRAASVLTGVIVLSGLYALGRKWNWQTGFFAALCYALMPWTFFHERLAVADSLVAACAVVMMVAVFRYTKHFSWATLFVLIASMIALPLAKLSAATLLVMPLIIVWFSPSSPPWLSKGGGLLGAWEKFKKLFSPYLITISVLFFLLGYANLRYGVASEITMRAGFGERPMWAWWWGNLKDVWEWGSVYAPLIGSAFMASLVLFVWRRDISAKIFLIGALVAFGTYLLAPSTAYPRYYLPALMFASLLGAWAINLMTQKLSTRLNEWLNISGALFLSLGFVPFIFSAYLNPLELTLAKIDQQQHLTLWSAGYGLREAGQYVSERSRQESESSIVYVSDLAGMVTARLYWTGDGKMLTLWDATLGASVEDVQERVASGKPTFLIVDTDHFKANFVGLKVNPIEIQRFPRPFDGKPVIVYRLKYEAFQYPKD